MNDIIGYGAPSFYDHTNANLAQKNPSSIHIQDTGLNRFFMRYLLQKAISLFKWNIPKEWSREYFLYCMYLWGFVAIIETDKFGVIPQACGLRGFDVFYRPTHAIITNPLLTGILEPRIDKECTLLKLQPDYCGLYDLVSYYANLMSLCAETACINIQNSKLSYVFFAKNKTLAETFKKLYDRIASGEPMSVVDKALFDDEGNPLWQAFTQDLRSNFIAPELLETMRTLEMRFDQELGIPTVINEKKERLNVDETNSNNVETYSRPSMWLEQLQEGCEKTRNMFGIDISVDWRFKEVVDNQLNPQPEVNDNEQT